MKSISPLPIVLLVIAAGMFSATGCVGYRVGSSTLYAPDVRTVYVPMIESDSFRRDLGERLTEAVVKEIELKTPYKVIASPNADSVLDIHLLRDTRRTLAEDAFDNPRLFENKLRAEVAWQNRRQLAIGAGADTSPCQGNWSIRPFPRVRVALVGVTPKQRHSSGEAGQTIASQQQLAIVRLAEQIVGTMETPW